MGCINSKSGNSSHTSSAASNWRCGDYFDGAAPQVQADIEEAGGAEAHASLFTQHNDIWQLNVLVNALLISAGIAALVAPPLKSTSERAKDVYGFLWMLTLMLNFVALTVSVIMVTNLLKMRTRKAIQVKYGKSSPVWPRWAPPVLCIAGAVMFGVATIFTSSLFYSIWVTITGGACGFLAAVLIVALACTNWEADQD